VIDPDDPQQVEDAVTEIQTEYAKHMFFEIRDAAGFVADEIIVSVTYPRSDGTPHSVEIHLKVDKAEFEEVFLDMAKRRLIEDAKRHLGLDADDIGPVPDDPDDAPE
jgi:hypothetical protein